MRGSCTPICSLIFPSACSPFPLGVARAFAAGCSSDLEPLPLPTGSGLIQIPDPEAEGKNHEFILLQEKAQTGEETKALLEEVKRGQGDSFGRHEMASPARSIGAAESWQKHKLREQLLRAGLLSSTPDGTTGRYVNELSRSAEDAPQAGTGYSTPSACQTPRIPKGGGGNNDEFEFESFPYENSATQPLLASEARLQVVPEKRLKKTERRAVERVTRERKKTTYWQCVSNVLNLYVGIGLLSKPYAVRIGGWASLGLLAVICVVFNQTAKILSRSFDALGCSGNAQEHHSLAYLAEQVLRRRGKQLVTCLVLLEFMGALCMCLIIVWSSLASLFPELGLTNAVVGITTVALVPVLLIDDYSRMSFLSMIGVLSNFMIVVSLVALIADDPNRKDIKSFHLPETDEYSIFNPGQAPIAMGIFVVSLAGHASLPTLR